jgi:peptide/nickel transport system substrate-binding protein
MTSQPRALVAALLLGTSPAALWAQIVEPTTPPPAPEFAAQGEPVFVNRDEIFTYRALPEYHEPEWVTSFVEAGVLPPVEERLPEEPLVYEAGNMPDGVGTYGDVMRHVIGGRPEGWNYQGGQNQGWGGIDIGLFECLTRTGPLFQVNAEDLQPLPNLARSWEWAEDGMSLTVNLIEGAKWSDGDPFDTEDIRFHWENAIVDPEVTPVNGESPETFGVGTTLDILGPYQFRWGFHDARSRSRCSTRWPMAPSAPALRICWRRTTPPMVASPTKHSATPSRRTS